jgi:hypothetical protein
MTALFINQVLTVPPPDFSLSDRVRAGITRGKVATELSNLVEVRFGVGETVSWRLIEPFAAT